MKCRNPFVQGMHVFPCGACMPCRINRRRLWQHRLMLESYTHESSVFLTLTYKDSALPRTPNGLSTLDPPEVQRFMKRIREALRARDGSAIRFYLVGEYGDETFRPHYHAALFGFPPCERGRTLVDRGRSVAYRCCRNCQMVQDCWQHGDVELGTLEEASAGYLAGYVIKKMTRDDDPRLEGRHPEFARMSRRPGIAFDALDELSQTLMVYDLDQAEDVPRSLRHGKRELPLGRYLRNKLRLMFGKEEGAPEKVLMELAEKLRPLREAAARSEDCPSFKKQVVEAFASACQSLETRSKIYKQRKSI